MKRSCLLRRFISVITALIICILSVISLQSVAVLITEDDVLNGNNNIINPGSGVVSVDSDDIIVYTVPSNICNVYPKDIPNDIEVIIINHDIDLLWIDFEYFTQLREVYVYDKHYSFGICQVNTSQKIPVTFYGYSDSTMHFSALSNGYDFICLDEVEETTTTSAPLVLYGDINNDGVVSIADIIILLKYFEDPYRNGLSSRGIKVADVNRDNQLTFDDIRIMLDMCNKEESNESV